MAYVSLISQMREAEPRRFARRAAGWLAQVETGSGMSIGRTDNVSAGGLLLRTQDTLAPGTEVLVRFHLPPGAAGPLIESRARVVRAETGNFMGMQFLNLSELNRTRLEQYVRQAPS